MRSGEYGTDVGERHYQGGGDKSNVASENGKAGY